MLPVADKLILQAQQGEKLSSKDRRHCISYLLATSPESTNVAMANLFQVSEGQIRHDRKTIREERAKLIKEDDIGLVIADIALNFDRQVRDIEKSKRDAKTGSMSYLQHCKAIFQLELEKVKVLQDLGYYPKNLGNMTVDKFEYKAIVSKDGNVDTRETNLKFNAQGEIQEAEFEVVIPKALDAPAEPVEAETAKND